VEYTPTLLHQRQVPTKGLQAAIWSVDTAWMVSDLQIFIFATVLLQCVHGWWPHQVSYGCFQRAGKTFYNLCHSSRAVGHLRRHQWATNIDYLVYNNKIQNKQHIEQSYKLQKCLLVNIEPPGVVLVCRAHPTGSTRA
jgi:hypothetical protein